MKEGSAMTEILAIDDDREILAVIKKALLREGYQVTALEVRCNWRKTNWADTSSFF